MKEDLETKYVPPSFSDRLMDKWNQYIQGNKSAKEYVAKFNEFLIRCSTINKEGQTQVLSKFRARLREDLWAELFTRWVTQLEEAYVLVQKSGFSYV